MRLPRSATALAFLGFLVLALFFDLLAGGTMVAGSFTADLTSQFIAWRQFGFGELARGNLALWNPQVYGGAPYFGGFQAALLYPPNVLFLFLPLAAAINWSLALHVFLLGAFMYLWAKRCQLHPAAATLAGVIVMFGGSYFPHLYAGHLSNLCAMPWAPLVLLAVEGLCGHHGEGPASKGEAAAWCCTGILALAMQILAGHPQYVFYTGIAAGIYAAVRLLARGRSRRRWPRTLFQLACLAAIPLGALALTAVQWLTGLQAASETLRSKALPFEFAAIFSLPPENLLTLVAPFLFGGLDSASYFGRCYLWEMSLFAGVTAFTLALLALLPQGRAETRDLQSGPGLAPAIALGLLLLLALGDYTPLFRYLYLFVPGFNKFRGVSKFIFPASLFLALLAATGFDRLIRTRSVRRSVVVTLVAAGGGAGILAFVSRFVDWLPLLRAVAETGNAYLLQPELFASPALSPELQALAEGASRTVSKSLFLATGTALLLGGLFAWLRAGRRAVWAVGALAVLELFVFARSMRDTFDSQAVVPPEIMNFVRQHRGEGRQFNFFYPNNALLTGAEEMNGDDPMIVRRYAEFVAAVEGQDPDQVTQELPFASASPLYSLLRLRWALTPGENGALNAVDFPSPPMPNVTLVGRAKVIEGRDAILAAMRVPAFDPRREVILESVPDPLPSGKDAGGWARVVSSATDWLEIEAETREPAILLITDLYTPAWRATPLAGSIQQDYRLLPADYILRAVPLTAGHHHLRVEYRPRAFVIGSWISILSGAGYLVFLVCWWFRRPVPGRGGPGQAGKGR